MKGVPPEIDDLMWRLAEESSPVAQAEFESRHARYGSELARRIQMVAQLRAAGKPVTHRPAFTPRPTRVAPVRSGAIFAAFGLAALAVGAVAYVIASGGEPPRVAVEPTVRPQPAPPVTPPKVENPLVKEEPMPLHPFEEAIKPQPQPTYEKPHDIRIEDTALTTAIDLVAKGGGLQVTIAPGFADRKVTLDYRGLTPVDTLKAMGQEYSFTVVEEEAGKVLVIPVREAATDRRISG